MEIKDYYSTLTNLGIKMLYQSDNLWRLQNPLDALNYISKDAYKILDEKFSQNLRNKYLNPRVIILAPFKFIIRTQKG